MSGGLDDNVLDREAVQGARDAGATAEVDVEAALAWRDLMVSNHTHGGQVRWLASRGIDLLRGTGRLAGGSGRSRRQASIMTSTANTVTTQHEPELLGQTVVLIGGSAGIGLETARQARREGADVILTGRDPERLRRAALEVDARSTAAFDATDPPALKGFFEGLPDPIDHLLITAGGPAYGPMLEMSADEVRDALSDHVLVALAVARHAAPRMRPGGTLLLMGGTGGRKISRELGIASAATAVLPPFAAALALELAPVRVNLIAAGFVDTPLSASLLGDDIDKRREELRSTLPIGRVVGSADVAALAVHIMTNTALTGGTYDIDGGQQFVA